MDLLMESVRSVQEPEMITEGIVDRIRDFVGDARDALSDVGDRIVDFFDEFDLSEFAASIKQFFSNLSSGGNDPIQGHLNRLYNLYLEKMDDDEDGIDYRLMGTFLDKDVEDYARANDVPDVKFLQGLVLAAIIGRGQIGDYKV